MTDLIKQIASDLQKQIDAFEPEISISDVGTVSEAGDGIARVAGLANVKSQELVQFANGVIGIAFNLEEKSVGVIIMGDYAGVTEGMSVRALGRIASVPVGDGLIGRVVNALGEPMDGKGPVQGSGFRPIERIGPGVVYRQDVDTPVQTGIKSIDSMIPDRTRAARTDHRRPPDGQDRPGDRYDHQPEGQEPYLYLCRHRPEEGGGGAHAGHPGTRRRDGAYHHRDRRSG